MQTPSPLPCRAGCAACCIAPSIHQPFFAMPRGKPAGVRCTHLDAQQRCRLFNDHWRPACCSGVEPALEMCGESAADALHYLMHLELLTTPGDHS